MIGSRVRTLEEHEALLGAAESTRPCPWRRRRRMRRMRRSKGEEVKRRKLEEIIEES